MKILHTSDWHLGRNLYGRKRYEEFESFLNWLAETIEQQEIDALLVAGDIFDTGTPSNRAQELYYRFLCRVADSSCRHIVVIAGNHDSPSFLNAPKAVLRALNVYVVGAMGDCLDDEVIVLKDEESRAQAIICAVPYLRDRDIRTVEAGETLDDKNAKLVDGLRVHYADVCSLAEQTQAELYDAGQKDVPVIGMGHLFAAGGKTVDGDGVRELYVGSLAYISADLFPASIDYLALGHLHVAQCVGGQEHIRYCGSPIAMGYGESGQDKKVIIVQFNETTPNIQELSVPCFQALERIVGTLDEITANIAVLKQNQSHAWLEIEYRGNDIVGNLRALLDDALAGSEMEILRIRNRRLMDRVMNRTQEGETLDDLNAHDVFERCLDAFDVSAADRGELTASYKEIMNALQEEDVNAE